MARTRTVLIASGLVIVFAALSVSPAMALHWSGNGSLSPYNVYQGVLTQFDFHLVNQASGSLDVYWVWAHFCWNPTNYGYYFKASDGTTVSIAGSGSYDFLRTVQVDQTTSGNCLVSIQVSGKAIGDLLQETATYSDSVNVLSIPPLQLSVAANPTTGVAPLTVYFSSTVSGGLGPYTYAWTFGDGGSSSQANPSHAYQTAGAYTATLVVSDSQGTQKSSTAAVTVIAPLAATAAADVTSGTIPFTVSFTASASGGAAPYAYAWNFGDGGTSNLQNPIHTYQVAGTYTVTLTVTDAGGRTSTKTLQVVANASPFTGSGTGVPPWVIYLVAAVAVLGLVGMVLVRRRRNARLPPQPPTPPGGAPPMPPNP